MAIHQYAVIETATGVVVNRIVLDSGSVAGWVVGDGLELHTTPDVGNIGDTWTGSAFTGAVAPAPTPDEVDVERERRTNLPLTIVLTSPDRTFDINMDGTALRNMNGLATGALLQKMVGDTTPTPFITNANDQVSLSPDDMISLGLQVQARITAMTFAGRTLKDTDPIPSDYAADSHWS